jgi:hypothetical protein
LRKSELVDLLCRDKGLPARERELFRQFCRLVIATYHFEYHQRLEEMKDAYAPFNPDADTRTTIKYLPEEKEQKREELFKHFTWLMERANYKHLTRDEIIAGKGTSDWGLEMDVDFSAFERLDMFARGDIVGKRTRRRLANWFRQEEVKVPIYQRLVLILKMRPNKRLSKRVNTDTVYLKLFKEFPKLDLEMLLPGARWKMPRLERGKLGASLLSSVAWIAYKIFEELNTLTVALVESNPLVFWGPLSLVAGYGYKQWSGYQASRQAYSLQLTENLFFQNLDNNAGVLYHLLDEAEEQECREAILAYFHLWRNAPPEGWTSGQLDDYVELDLERLANLKVDFEIEDAIAKLEKLRIIEKRGDRYRAQPLDKALEMLDWTWDNYFKYNNPEPEEPPL